MGQYIERINVVEAVQWDGTEEGFYKLRDLIRKSGRSLSWNLSTQGNSLAPDLDAPRYKLVLGDNLWGFESGTKEAQVRKSDWLVFVGGGVLKLMTDHEFARKYKEMNE